MFPDDDVRRAVLTEGARWIGTPYRHQASTRGVGCDCLGLVRGIWRALYGAEAEAIPAYPADWTVASGDDRLLKAARHHCIELDAPEARPGDLLLLRWRSHLPASHAAIVWSSDEILHAYERHAVCISPFVPHWRRRIAGAFAFPSVGGEPEGT